MSTEKPPLGAEGEGKRSKGYSSFDEREAVRSRSISFATSSEGLLSARRKRLSMLEGEMSLLFSRSSSMRFSKALNSGCWVMGVFCALKWFMEKIVTVQS